MRLGDVKIGSIVSLHKVWGCVGMVVGGDDKQFILIGHDLNSDRHHHNEMDIALAGRPQDAINLALASKYSRGAWFHRVVDCELVSGPVFNESLKCSQCKRPLPHMESKDKECVCVECLFEKEMSELEGVS